MTEALIDYPERGIRLFSNGAAAIGLRLQKEFIVLLQAIVESYDHLGLVRTLPRPETRVAILTTADRLPQVLALLSSLRGDIPWGFEDLEGYAETEIFPASRRHA
jgi:hypothetical protein